jgi:DNA-binding NarL/FixJ family response regulator
MRVLRAGAAGYLTKESAPEELVKAIQKVLAGGRYVSPSLAEKLADALDEPEPGRPLHESLTDREFQVMRHLVSGKSVTEIAKDLGRSVKTVSTQRTRILSKMRMRSNVELARYAVETHLFE